MARKNRRRQETPRGPDVTRLSYGGARKEERRGQDWFVRDIPAHRAEKTYRCPGCANDIPQGQAHVVAWKADHLFGNEVAAGERRHWHAHCWRLF